MDIIVKEEEQNLLLLQFLCSFLLLLLQFFSDFAKLFIFLFFFLSSVRAAPEHVPCGQQEPQEQRTRLISFRDFMRLHATT